MGVTRVVSVRQTVRLSVAHGVGTIVLDCPPVNALSRAAQAELRAAAAEAAARDEVRSVVLWGEGGVFSAGADIKEMAAMSHAEMAGHAPHLQAAFREVAAIPKPVVAAIQGPALGGGCELALAADHRVCGESSRIGLPEIRLGVIPGAGGTQRLARLVGPALAKQMIFTGRPLDAATALAAALVDEVVADSEVLTIAMDWARQFTTGPRHALAAAKAAIDAGADLGLADGLVRETTLFAGLFATQDRDTGMRHFLRHLPGDPPFAHTGEP